MGSFGASAGSGVLIRNMKKIRMTVTAAFALLCFTAQGKTDVALRTNLLMPLMNIGAEMTVGKRVSLGADVYYPWLKVPSDGSWCIQCAAADMEARLWLGRRSDENRLAGHFLTAGAMAALFDVGFNGEGVQGKGLSTWIGYGYALKINRCRLSFSLGGGVIFARWRQWHVFEGESVPFMVNPWDNVMRFIGPSYASVRLTLPLN